MLNATTLTIKSRFLLLQLGITVFILVTYFLYLNFIKGQTTGCVTEERQVNIHGSSMSEVFKSGEKSSALMGYYQCHEVKRGDTVLVKRLNSNEILIKNVLMIPGDNFYVRGMAKGINLVVNNSIIQTPKGFPYFFPRSSERILKFFEQTYKNTIPENLYFVFGTRSNGSFDSSYFGPVNKNELIGKIQL